MLRNKKLSEPRATMKKNYNNQEGSKDSEHYPLSNAPWGEGKKGAIAGVQGKQKDPGK
jgi:hypothetical protein